MSLRIEEAGTLDDGKPGVVLRGSEADVRRAARYFSEAVSIVPVSALARVAHLIMADGERGAVIHPITKEAAHG